MIKIRTSHGQKTKRHDQNTNITWSKYEHHMIIKRTSHGQNTNIT